MQKQSVTEKVKNVLGVGHGHHHGTTGVTGTHNGGVVHQVENAVTGHHGPHTTTGTTGHHGPHTATGTTGLGTTTPAGVVHKVENAVTGHGTHGTHAHGTHGTTHASGPAGLIAKAKLKVTGHT